MSALGRRLRGHLGLAALAAFVVADVVLVALALDSTAATPGTAGSAPRPSAVTTASPGPATDGDPVASQGAVTAGTPTQRPSSSLAPAPLEVGVVAVDADTAWRFVVGDCAKGGSTVTITRDGGHTWAPMVAPFDTTVRIRVKDNGGTFAIGSDDSCTPRFRRAAKDATSWGSAMSVPGAWYRDPSDPVVVGTAAGTRAKPCGDSAVIDLGVTDRSAEALCADGRLRRSETGETWTGGGAVEGGLALAATATRTLVARTADGCTGVAVVDATAPETALGCAEVDLATVEPGRVALAERDGQAWLVAGDTVFRSSADLSEWTSATGPSD